MWTFHGMELTLLLHQALSDLFSLSSLSPEEQTWGNDSISLLNEVHKNNDRKDY